MRTSRVVFAGIAVAAAAATTSAFTASNTVPASIAGYGQAQVTGVTVTDISYVPYTGDNTKVQEIDFVTTDDVSAATYNASMTLKSDATTVVDGPAYTCSIGAYSGGKLTITCLTADHPKFADFTYVGLTVNQ